MNKLVASIANTHKMKFVYSHEVADQISIRCIEVETSARNILTIMNGTILPVVSKEILARMGEETMPSETHLDLAKDSSFVISFQGG